MNTRTRLAAAGLLFLTTHVRGQEQEILRTWPFAGYNASLLPDIDGDGAPELLMGEQTFDAPARPSTGVLRVLSSSGQVLFEVYGTESFQGFGLFSGPAGDIDADGYQDFMGSGGFYGTRIISGYHGFPIMEHPWPSQAIVPLGDRDQDGFDDFVVCSREANRAFLYRGGSFELVQEIVPPPPARLFGWAMTGLGDVDDDGFIDIAVGAPGHNFNSDPGQVFVYSGREMSLLYRLAGSHLNDEFGLALTSPGDIDGDGAPDLAVGVPGCCNVAQPFGQVRFFSGRDGTLLSTIDYAPLISVGGFLDNLGDVNGDGFGDIAARASGPDDLCLDGHDQSFLYRLDTFMVGGGHDWNDDGFPDWIEDFNPHHRLVSGAPPGSAVLGRPCGTFSGKPPRIGASGAPRIGADYPIHLSDVPPEASALLVVGGFGKLSPASPPAGRCHAMVRAAVRVPVLTQKIAPNRGAATVALSLPSDATLVGTRFQTQWIVLDRGRTVASTRILELEVFQ